MSDPNAPPEAASLWEIVSGARPDERRALALAFLQFFCILASYYLLRPVRDQFSAAVGSTNLWQFWTGTFIVTLLLTPVFGAMVARWPRERFIPATYGFFIACLIAFVPAFAAGGKVDARMLGIVFYIWLSVFNLFVVSVFWSFMADLFDGLQARRLFPAISVGGTLGAIFGPLLASVLPIVGLLLASIALLLVAMACTWRLSAWAHDHPSPARRAELAAGRVIGGGAFAGIAQVFASPFLRKMVALMLLGDAIGTLAYALTADVVAASATDSEARKTIYAHIDLMTNTLQLALQMVVARRLLRDFGAVGALVADALIKVAVLVETMLIGAPMVIPMLVVTRGSSYGVGKPGADALYARAGREARYKAKNTIETAGWRFGDVVVSLGMKGMTALGFGAVGFALISTLAAAACGWLGWSASRAPELEQEARADARDVA